MDINTLYKLRKSWFSLMTKAFIMRYFMGIVILVIFLPGVAIGENFNLLISSITKPFVFISQSSSPFMYKLMWSLVLLAVFVVWSQAQKQATKGGVFADFQESWPITESFKTKINVRMLLLSNHLLWPFMIASYFYLPFDNGESFLILVLRNTFIIISLLSIQYILLFKYSLKFIGWSLALLFLFTMPLKPNIEFYRLAACFGLMSLFVFHYLFKENSFSQTHFKIRFLLPAVISRNFYSQILFKSGLTSSLFRFLIMAGLMLGFTFSTNYWVEDLNELMPYYFALEAMLAYFISGFYVSFLDQRNNMKEWLITLPIKKHFWAIRDIMALILITTIFHGLFFIWAANHSEPITLLKAFSYHLLLLVVSYPLRVFLPEKQTFITFVVLFIITAITLFNLS
jgi:hypothetical protein